MTYATFDTLAATRMLQDSGVAALHAEAIVKMTATAVQEGVATKGDIAKLESDIAKLEGKIAELRAETKADFAELEKRLTNRMYVGLAAAVAILGFLMKFL